MSESSDPTRRYMIIGMLAVAYVMVPLLLIGMRDQARWDEQAAWLGGLPLPSQMRALPAPAPPPAPVADTPPIAVTQLAPLAVAEDEPLPEQIPASPEGAEVVLRKWEDLTFRFVRTTEESGFKGQLEIFVGPRRAFAIDSYLFLMPNETEGRVPALGEDITGNGYPNFVIKEWTGGAACCFLYHVFEWRDGLLHAIATLDASHTEMSVFRDIDGDGAYEFVTNDWTFAQWKTDLAQSPAPQIILYYSPADETTGSTAGYRLALHLMFRHKPTDAQLGIAAQHIAELPQWSETVPPLFWGEALKLVFEGNVESAWQFMREAWPAARPGRAAFVGEFTEQLRKSPHWSRLQNWTTAPPPIIDAVDTTSNMR